MDPRHPELAISRMRELMKQYDRIENDMAKATTSAKLAELEREGGLVIQEICLVAPRIHEAMMQTSRQRRHDLAHGVGINMSKYKVPEGASGEEVGVVEGPVGIVTDVENSDGKIAVHDAKPEEYIEKPKKKATKKKATKKKAEK